MRKSILYKLKWFYTLALIILLYASCNPLKFLGVTGSSSQYSLIATEGLSVSHIPNEEYFYVNLHAAYYIGEGFDPLDAKIYAMEVGPDTDCKISVEQDSTEDLYCIMEVMEGDLWFHNIVLEYNVPEGMCDYLSFDVPWHFNQRVGLGPETVYECADYEVSCDPGDEENEPTVETETQYCLGGCTQGSCGGEAVTIDCDGAGPREEAQQFCGILDQSENELSNCCMGDYTLARQDGGRSEVSWGGNLQECIGGSARTNWGYFNKDGAPITLIENTLKEGFRSTYEMPALIQVYDGANNTEEKPSFITANYWTDVENKESATSKPKFYVPPNGNQLQDYLREYDQEGYPYFTWSCLDKAREIKHRIHLVIREWNTQEEFNTFKDTEGGRGDPDVVGLEGSSCEYFESTESSILKDTECNDMWDADNRDAVAPGSGPGIDGYNPYPEIIYSDSG